jgi:Family of unknown function (DUF5677)
LEEQDMQKEELIGYARFLIERISEDFLQVEEPHIIMEGHEHLREMMTLYGKQTNLLESTLLLLENNMAEEALLLARSMMNSYMLIHYLTKDTKDRKRFKEYNIQPTKSKLKFLYDYKFGWEKGWIDNKPENIDLDKKIKELEDILKSEGVKTNKYGKINTTPITISRMAREDKLLFGYYITYYKVASSFEHSDPSSLEIYRQKILDEYDNSHVYLFNLSRTDTVVEDDVMKSAIGVYTMSFITIFKYYSENYEHLIKDRYKKLLKIWNVIGKVNF